MAQGIDFSFNISSLAEKLKKHGFEFVGRYFSTINRYKVITKAEAKTLSEAGLSIVSIWENGYPTHRSYFTHKQGRVDATAALHYATEIITQPAHTPIYFAVDYDVAPHDLAQHISAYFRGVIEVFSEQSLTDYYEIGIYGSGSVCQTMKAEFANIRYTWLARSGAWRGSNSYDHWNIRQGSETKLFGVTGDLNEARGDFGAWQI